MKPYTPETLYLSRKRAAEAMSLSPSTFDRWVDRKIIPGPVMTEGRVSLWSVADLQEAIEGRKNKRRGVITDPNEATKAAIREMRQ